MANVPLLSTHQFIWRLFVHLINVFSDSYRRCDVSGIAEVTRKAHENRVHIKRAKQLPRDTHESELCVTVSHIQLPPPTHHWPPKPSIKSNTSPNLYRKAFHPHRMQKSLKVYCEEEIYEHWKTPLNYTLNAFCSDQPGGRGFERRLYTSAGIKKIKQKN